MKAYKDFVQIASQLQQQSLGIKREDMPQINAKKAQSFIDFLKENGVKVKQTKVVVSTLKPTQREMNQEKLANWAETRKASEMGAKPAFVSKDNYILDGHHRAFAVKIQDPNFKFPVYRIDAPIRRVLQLAKEWPDVFYKALDEDAKDGMPMLNEQMITEGVAETILAQLGGNKFITMTGAKNFVKSDNSLKFNVGKAKNGIKIIRIVLDKSDTYTVEFAKLVKYDYKVVETRSNVYADNLKDVIGRVTGLALSL